MARIGPRPAPDREQVLKTVHQHCPACGGRLRYRYDNRHTVTTLAGLLRLRLQIRRCENPGCARHHQPYRPEAEGAIVLPQHEFGLDVIALIGAWRYRQHRSVPEIHRGLRERGVAIAERTVTHLLDRYDELVATTLTDNDRLRDALAYPEPASRYDDAQLQAALRDALLPALAARLDERDNWTQKLSGGEQQRLAIARVLLRQPAWVLADEATSALDVPAEQQLYARLRALTEQAGGALVSIAHRPSVAAFHGRRWQFVPQADAAQARYRIEVAAQDA